MLELPRRWSAARSNVSPDVVTDPATYASVIVVEPLLPVSTPLELAPDVSTVTLVSAAVPPVAYELPAE